MFYYIGIGKEWANFLSPLPGEQLFIALLQKRRERATSLSSKYLKDFLTAFPENHPIDPPRSVWFKILCKRLNFMNQLAYVLLTEYLNKIPAFSLTRHEGMVSKVLVQR